MLVETKLVVNLFQEGFLDFPFDVALVAPDRFPNQWQHGAMISQPDQNRATFRASLSTVKVSTSST